MGTNCPNRFSRGTKLAVHGHPEIELSQLKRVALGTSFVSENFNEFPHSHRPAATDPVDRDLPSEIGLRLCTPAATSADASRRPSAGAGRPDTNSLLPVPRIIRRINVLDHPGPAAVDLDDGFTLGPGEMLHAGRHYREAASDHFAPGGFIELIRHSEVECSRDDRDSHWPPSTIRGQRSQDAF